MQADAVARPGVRPSAISCQTSRAGSRLPPDSSSRCWRSALRTAIGELDWGRAAPVGVASGRRWRRSRSVPAGRAASSGRRPGGPARGGATPPRGGVPAPPRRDVGAAWVPAPITTISPAARRDVDLVRVAEQAAQPAQHRPERRDVGDRPTKRTRTVERPSDGPCHEQGAEREVPGVADEHRRSLVPNVLEAAEDRCPANGGEPGARSARHGRRGPNHRHRGPCGSPGTRRPRRAPSAARQGRLASRSSQRELGPSGDAPADRVLVGMEVRDRRPGVQRIDHLRRGPGGRHAERARRRAIHRRAGRDRAVRRRDRGSAPPADAVTARAAIHGWPMRGTVKRLPRRAAWRTVVAPAATMFNGPSCRRRAAAAVAIAASRSSITANGGSASGLNGTAGRRSSRPSGLGTCGPSTGASRMRATGTSRSAPTSRAMRSTSASSRPNAHVGSRELRSSGRLSAPFDRP